MNDTNTKTTPSNRTPSHVAYHVREFEGNKGKRGRWTRIGSAWPHADGKGFSIEVETLPLDGRISLRVATERKE